ncbi:MAG: hypothetical protein CW338_11825 [Clostridiales bacterium]|nr:hypothetical protein [Clostridiales bacterium]
MLVPASTGINMSEYEVLRAVGTPKKFTDPGFANRGAAVRFIEAKAGKVASVEVDYNAEIMVGIEELKFFCRSGKQYSDAQNNNDRFGYVIATGKTVQTAIERCRTALQHVKIAMEDRHE